MTDLWKIQNDDAFVKYAESELRLIGSLYENGYLFHINTREVTFINWFYGNPTCAIISQCEQWAAMGGDSGLTIWKQGATFDIEISGIFKLRQTGPVVIQILTDPWCEESAIWELNVLTFYMQKVRSFPDYIDREYADDVIW
ncbi:hypothetical protein [Chitinophaga flava]|uniref:Uncharacterized protein n=1 Tax=Chitinophaga flava TaxID=2259036 RepID=A0A365XWW7_9BACT|nr:hypothetical protein [Chitinophaga flava]RBL90075.1 hypothetical protein DF182_26755 [Chitinophaga flava]